MSCSPCSFSFLFSVIILHSATAYSELYREGSPGKGTFFRRQVYTRVGISPVEVYKRIGKSVILVCKRTWKCQQTHFRAVKKPRKLHGLVVYSNLKRRNSSKGCSVLNLVQWNLYSTDTSIQRTKNLVPEKCSHCLCIATSIEGSRRDISVQGKNTFCGPRDPGLTSIQGTPQHSKSDWPQKSLISALVTMATAFKTWTISPKSKIDVLHLWEFNTQHRRVAPRPPPVTTESVCISLHVLRGHEGRFFSDCFGRLYAQQFRHSVIWL